MASKQGRFALLLVGIVIGLCILASGIFTVVSAYENCESVKCEQVVDETSCTLTYNNITCTCNGDYDLGEPSKTTEDCSIDKTQDNPCPRRGKKECSYSAVMIAGGFFIALGLTIILSSCVMYHHVNEMN